MLDFHVFKRRKKTKKVLGHEFVFYFVAVYGALKKLWTFLIPWMVFNLIMITLSLPLIVIFSQLGFKIATTVVAMGIAISWVKVRHFGYICMCLMSDSKMATFTLDSDIKQNSSYGFKK